MAHNLVLLAILLVMGFYLSIPLVIVIDRLLRYRTTLGGEGHKAQRFKRFDGELDDCWTCRSKFWFQLEPEEPPQRKAPGVLPESGLNHREVLPEFGVLYSEANWSRNSAR